MPKSMCVRREVSTEWKKEWFMSIGLLLDTI